MNTPSYHSFNVSQSPWRFWLLTLAFIAGLVLSILSWLEICVEHCSANQEYRLFGFPFAIVGVLFFVGLLFLHILSRYVEGLSTIVDWSVLVALGAEVFFIFLQKYQIGHWCPICVSIAISIAFASLVILRNKFKRLNEIHEKQDRGHMMEKIKTSFSSFSFVLLGFLMAIVGVSQVDTAEATMQDIKERIAFGKKNSPVEVYFVSDWFCPSCKKIEPEIEKLYPKIRSDVAFYFIDYPIHKKSLNFTPYNLAFIVNNKPQYFQARQLLINLTDETESPSDEDIEKAAKKHGIMFRELSYLDVKNGIEYFDGFINQYNLNSTPTVLIVNPATKKSVKFEGRDEIEETKILKAIEKMQTR